MAKCVIEGVLYRRHKWKKKTSCIRCGAVKKPHIRTGNPPGNSRQRRIARRKAAKVEASNV